MTDFDLAPAILTPIGPPIFAPLSPLILAPDMADTIVRAVPELVSLPVHIGTTDMLTKYCIIICVFV